MKLLQNSAGNFLNMTPQEAKKFAEELLKSAEECLTAEEGRGAGFVQTIVIAETRHKVSYTHYGALDTVFVGISKSWLDVHPSLENELPLREPGILHIDRKAINVRTKE